MVSAVNRELVGGGWNSCSNEDRISDEVELAVLWRERGGGMPGSRTTNGQPQGAASASSTPAGGSSTALNGMVLLPGLFRGLGASVSSEEQARLRLGATNPRRASDPTDGTFPVHDVFEYPIRD
jgi:hypothetical protein